MIFSYWIFVWYLLYISKITNYNPKFILIIGLIENIIMLLMMIFFQTKLFNILWFIFINTFLKIIPLYTLINTKIQKNDILISFLIFIIYIFYLYLHKIDFTKQQKQIIYSLLYNKNNTPFLHLIHKWFNK
jgi:hypothetical protein